VAADKETKVKLGVEVDDSQVKKLADELKKLQASVSAAGGTGEKQAREGAYEAVNRNIKARAEQLLGGSLTSDSATKTEKRQAIQQARNEIRAAVKQGGRELSKSFGELIRDMSGLANEGLQDLVNFAPSRRGGGRPASAPPPAGAPAAPAAPARRSRSKAATPAATPAAQPATQAAPAKPAARSTGDLETQLTINEALAASREQLTTMNPAQLAEQLEFAKKRKGLAGALAGRAFKANQLQSYAEFQVKGTQAGGDEAVIKAMQQLHADFTNLSGSLKKHGEKIDKAGGRGIMSEDELAASGASEARMSGQLRGLKNRAGQLGAKQFDAEISNLGKALKENSAMTQRETLTRDKVIKEQAWNEALQSKDRGQIRGAGDAYNKVLQALRPLSTAAEQKQIDSTSDSVLKKSGGRADMDAFRLYGTGQALLMGGQVGRIGFQAGQNGFAPLAQQYSELDPRLTQAMRGNQRAGIALGQAQSPYQQFRLNVGEQLMGNGAAAGASIIGDVAGSVAGPLGGLLQTAAMMSLAGQSNAGLGKILAGGGKALGFMAGPVGLGAASGVAAGSLGYEMLRNANIGGLGSKVGAMETIDSIINPTQYYRNRVGAEAVAAYGNMDAATREEYKKNLGTAKDQIKDFEKNEGLFYATGSDTRYGKLAGTARKLGISEDLIQQGDYAKLKGAIEGLAVPVEGSDALKKAIKSPEIQQQIKAMKNQFADFFIDIGKQAAELKRNFSRSMEDIGTQKERATEDFNIGLQRIGTQRARLTEDYQSSIKKLETQVTRTKRDAAISRERLEEDTARSTLRLQQDTARQTLRLEQDTAKARTRLTEDVTKSRTRLEEDTTTSVSRLTRDTIKNDTRLTEDYVKSTQYRAEDFSRNMSRLTEDSSRDRGRVQEDYTVNRQQLTRSFARNEQDLQQGFQDSMIGIMAPGLAQSRGYQMMRLMRDYKKNRRRLREDKKTEFSNLDRGYGRSMSDINRNEQRGKEDLQRDFQRGQEEADKAYQRGKDDIAESYNRGLEDARKGYERASADIAQQQTRGEEDISQGYSRGKEDIATAAQRGQEDIDRNATRGRADIERNLNDALEDAATARMEIERNYQRGLQDLLMQEQDLRRNYNRTMDDLNKAAGRLVEDFNTASESMTEAVRRFTRDFGEAMAAFNRQLNGQFGTSMNDSELNSLTGLSNQSGYSPATTPGESGGVPGSFPGVDTPAGRTGGPSSGSGGSSGNSGYGGGSGGGGGSYINPKYVPKRNRGGYVEANHVAEVHGGEWIVNPNHPDKKQQASYAINALKELGYYKGSFWVGGTTGGYGTSGGGYTSPAGGGGGGSFYYNGMPTMGTGGAGYYTGGGPRPNPYGYAGPGYGPSSGWAGPSSGAGISAPRAGGGGRFGGPVGDAMGRNAYGGPYGPGGMSGYVNNGPSNRAGNFAPGFGPGSAYVNANSKFGPRIRNSMNADGSPIIIDGSATDIPGVYRDPFGNISSRRGPNLTGSRTHPFAVSVGGSMGRFAGSFYDGGKITPPQGAASNKFNFTYNGGGLKQKAIFEEESNIFGRKLDSRLKGVTY
jgi:hypothetical protein